MVYLKNAEEIAAMREANRIVKDALAEVEEKIRPGMTTADVNRIVHFRIIKEGAKPSFLNYHGYPASACVSVDEVVIHGIPNKKRILEEGNIVSVDVGAFKNGFHGDAARTFCIGKVSEEKEKLVRVTRESFFQGVEQFREGNRLGDISFAIQSHAEQNGFSVVRSFVGHGIGREMHEDPNVPNYGRKGHGLRLQKGMALAIEPMVNIGTFDVRMLDDGWTVVTADGLPSAHYENTVVLTENGVEILTL